MDLLCKDLTSIPSNVVEHKIISLNPNVHNVIPLELLGKKISLRDSKREAIHDDDVLANFDAMWGSNDIQRYRRLTFRLRPMLAWLIIFRMLTLFLGFCGSTELMQREFPFSCFGSQWPCLFFGNVILVSFFLQKNVLGKMKSL